MAVKVPKVVSYTKNTEPLARRQLLTELLNFVMPVCLSTFKQSRQKISQQHADTYLSIVLLKLEMNGSNAVKYLHIIFSIQDIHDSLDIEKQTFVS